MLQSMTGFGSGEARIAGGGKICVELRSSNHKFLETVLHLPEGLLSWEEGIKKEIESKVKRGRVTCAVNIVGAHSASASINKPLLKSYIQALEGVKGQLRLKDGLSINTIIHLPGVVALEENKISKSKIWPVLKIALKSALADFLKTRRKEGKALYGFLKTRSEGLKSSLSIIRVRFKKAVGEKLASLDTEEERVSFLKEADITEEIERLEFHARNFKNKLSSPGPVGKELDFIAQEMQREANTLAAKSCDVAISARVIQMKSLIEKIREQAQNIE